ncbi:hypothetical protein TanjilG_22855 [Lupinus angustifolius]|uniref:DUF7792 domain-containing protein n=1 Tax=Lupinus angustifolius TaxID=3871 RepID=A0A4P1RHP1_LUPAN|nr:hypothetical protein TanjilG_22855 [Lupinus angustifolius]
MKQFMVKTIHLADQVCKAADEATFFKQNCLQLKSNTDKLASLLHTAARATSDLYERPILDTHKVLDKALSLVLKSRTNGLFKRVFNIISTNAFRKTSSLFENSTGDVSWLLRVSNPAGDRADADTHLGLPPIAANVPMLYSALARRRIGPARRRYWCPLSAAMKMVQGLFVYWDVIMRVWNILLTLVCVLCLLKFSKKVQCVVAWAISELAANNPNCQHKLAQHNIISFLVSHLAFETVQEHSNYAIVSNRPTSVHALVMAHSNDNSDNVKKGNYEDEEKLILNRMPNPFDNNAKAINQLHWVITSTIAVHKAATKLQDNNKANEVNKNHQSSDSTKNNGNSKQGRHHLHSYSPSGFNMKGREVEDPETEASMKEMAARALWQLAKGNSQIFRSITESRALLCFTVLLERGPKAVQYNSAMALMEITAVAEKDADLRRFAFKPNSPACIAVVDQMVKIVEREDSDLLIPCMKAIGNLAKTFKATENRMIGPLVELLDAREAEVMKEAIIALTKFACTENYLHIDHAEAIISAGGAKHLIHLVYFGEQMVQKPALVLLSYIALHVPDSKELAQDRVVGVLEWASKQAFMTQDETLEALLQESKSKLEPYQLRGSRGFHKSKSKLEPYQSRGFKRIP